MVQKKSSQEVVRQRPLIDCTLGKELLDSYSMNKIRCLVKAAVVQAMEMWKNRMAKIRFNVLDWACQIKLEFKKEHRYHIFGYVFTLEVENYTISCIIDQQLIGEPELINNIRWRNSEDSISFKDLHDLWREHVQYRSTLG